MFNTPNPLPAPAIQPREVENDPDFRDAIEPQHCYICKQHYSTLHHFYDQLCPECAELNFRKRTELADLSGRVALLTGGRVKIGYQAGIRAAAVRRATDRDDPFPARLGGALLRRSRTSPSGATGWRSSGWICATRPSVEAFCRHLMTTRNRLDFIINNACQTVRRPPDFYEHMMAQETGLAPFAPGSGAEPARRLRRACAVITSCPKPDASVLAPRSVSEVGRA